LIATVDPVAAEPAVFIAGPAASERTLVAILAETTSRHPHAAAIDDGRRVVTYRRLQEEINSRAREMKSAGIGVGDRVGVRIESGTAELYVAILAIMSVGAAYVPVDADDPQGRADLVFGEAQVCAVLGAGSVLETLAPPHGLPGRASHSR
jgi:non-ribosomal peptide synthetase component F